MHPYRTIEAAYDAVTRRQPAWIATLTPTPHNDGDRRVGRTGREQLAQIIAIINSDPGDTPASDDMLRRLIAIGRDDSDAITVILRAFLPRMRARIHKAATVEFHGDALTSLAMVCLDSDLTGDGLAMRLLNRAHNRAWREGNRIRTRGEINVFTTNPLEPELLSEIQDREGKPTADHADHVAQVVDLARFSSAVHAAVARGEITTRTWNDFRDLKLARSILGGQRLTATQRTHAFRARQGMRDLIDILLSSHAA
jgi:hypothetical protein